MRASRFALASLVAAAAACDGVVDPSIAAQSFALASPGTLTVPARASPLAPFEVTVSDADPNVDPTRRDAVFVYVWTDVASTQVRFVLEETDVDTSVFKGEVTIPSSAQQGQTAYVAYRDSNVGDAACGSQTLPPKALPVNTQADLTIEKIEFVDQGNQPLPVQTTRLAGEPVRIHVVVRNDRGSAYSTGWARMPLYIIGPGEYPDEVDARPIGQDGWPGYYVGALAPGAAYDVYVDNAIPSGIGGPWSISANVHGFYDEYNEWEFSYTNNSRDLPLQITPADLLVSNATHQLIDRTLTATVDVKNADGAGIAGPSTMRVRLFGPQALDDEGYPYNPTWDLATPAVGTLAPGATQTFTTPPFTIDPSTHGSCALLVELDVAWILVEASETNNSRTIPITCP